jgi:hypothetical protein
MRLLSEREYFVEQFHALWDRPPNQQILAGRQGLLLKPMCNFVAEQEAA